MTRGAFSVLIFLGAVETVCNFESENHIVLVGDSTKEGHLLMIPYDRPSKNEYAEIVFSRYSNTKPFEPLNERQKRKENIR